MHEEVKVGEVLDSLKCTILQGEQEEIGHNTRSNVGELFALINELGTGGIFNETDRSRMSQKTHNSPSCLQQPFKRLYLTFTTS